MIFMANNSCEIGKKIAQAKLDELEKALADETAEMNVEKVESVETLQGNFFTSWVLETEAESMAQKLQPSDGKTGQGGKFSYCSGNIKTAVSRYLYRKVKTQANETRANGYLFSKKGIMDIKIELYAYN